MKCKSVTIKAILELHGILMILKVAVNVLIRNNGRDRADVPDIFGNTNFNF